MDGPIIITIVSLIVLLGIVVLFFVADILTKGSAAKKSDSGKSDAGKTASVAVRVEASRAGDVSEASNDSNIASTLATEIEALIVDDTASRGDKIESASQRSRMHNRRARMVEYYDKKYKSRTVIFDPNSFDEPVSPSSSGAFVIDGVEITKEDVKKLTALNDLLARKNFDE